MATRPTPTAAIFNDVSALLPVDEGDEPWTYELFIGVTKDEMEELIAKLTIQQRSKLRTLFHNAQPAGEIHVQFARRFVTFSSSSSLLLF